MTIIIMIITIIIIIIIIIALLYVECFHFLRFMLLTHTNI